MNEWYDLLEKTIAMLTAVFAHHPEVERVILYGSGVKDSYKSASLKISIYRCCFLLQT